MKYFWTAYLAFMIWMSYDLITSSISKIVRNKLDTDIDHLSIVATLWAIWIMFYLT